MNVEEVLGQARDAITVKRVFGEAYQQDGLTMIPVAAVRGGAGGGGGAGHNGNGHNGDGQASGGGFGIDARPAGAFVIREGEVAWRPALDLNRVILGGQIVVIVALLTLRSIARRKLR